MATRKTSKTTAKSGATFSSRSRASSAIPEGIGSILATVSGPSNPTISPDDLTEPAHRRLALQKTGAQELSEAVPANPLKPTEFGYDNGHAPTAGQPIEPSDDVVTASTVQEDIASTKLGSGTPVIGHNPTNGPLDRVRADSGGQTLTTNQGVPVADNQNSLKAGLRGPTLLEDFILREKITHFDHERIPERIVHARGSAAHGVFESYEALDDLTRADPFTEAGKVTPVFVRFSTVAGERGSADTARDTRGFAVKFYTQQGNWDLVGNNIPVFFIQDSMKFPDLIHSVKPEPNNGIPQASSAHDTFWDFISLSPEATHHTMWVMSDHGLPRSYRTMRGFGVNTYRLVNAAGESVFVKFHWLPVAGTHSLVWDEAVKIAGCDSDFHRRDLWEAIEAGVYPEYELALQTFTEEQAESFSFDVLDATKLVPEELVPLRVVGKMTLNRNPDNFFAETEQVAFCTAHVVPGIDFSNDPLLQGRIHSYLDTQLSRLGGPNFHEIPINSPVVGVHNNQRDGKHRQTINRGRVSYEPNSLAGGCPFQAGSRGFVPVDEPISATPAAARKAMAVGAQAAEGRTFIEDKVRGKPEKFADHFTQATLFFNSQSSTEQKHIAAAFRFELSRVGVPAIRERMVSVLRNVDEGLARDVADGLGMALPPAQQKALETPVAAEVTSSDTLSLLARPGDGSVRGMRVALLVANGVDATSLRAAYQALAQAQAVPRFVGTRLGQVQPVDGDFIEVEATFENMPSVLWDALVLPAGDAALAALGADALAFDFVKEQYRHAKPMLVLDPGTELLSMIGIKPTTPSGDADPGLVMAEAGGEDASAAFLAALAKHRHFEREQDPPAV